MEPITVHLPKDVLEDLAEIAPMLGFSRAEPLMRAYIARGLRQDIDRLQGTEMASLTESLRKQGVSDEVISAAVSEARLKVA